MDSRFRLVARACGVALFATTLAHAAAITFDFTGHLTYAVSPPGLFGGVITPSSTLTGSYTFDSLAADQNATPDAGEYAASGPPFGITVDIAGVVFSSPAVTIRLVNNFFGFDQLYAVATSAFAGPAGTSIDNLALSFTDFTQLGLSGDALPLVPPPFQDSQFALFGYAPDGSQFSFNGTLDSLTLPTEVPEPATWLVAGVALLAIARARPRR